MRQSSDKNLNRPREIAVLIPLSAGLARGLRQFAETRAEPWFFQPLPLHGFSIQELISSSQLDGALVYSGDEKRDSFFAELPIPIVDISSVHHRSKLPRVVVDSHAMGREAARHLLSKGHQNFAFIGFDNMVFSQRREKGFKEELGFKSLSARTCLIHQDGTPEELPQPDRDRTLRDFITSLALPCGVYVATDTLALRISVLTRELGIKVPVELALLGSDNRESSCLLAAPPLSSVPFPDVELGRRAAERLAELMDGTGNSDDDWLVTPGPVIERASTESMQVHEANVQRALNWIWENSTLGAGVDHMAKELQLSRRELERSFRKHLNASPLEIIQRERVKTVRQNLMNFESSLEEVAENSGFGNSKWMTTVFKRYTGMTPAAYRRRQVHSFTM